MRSIFPGLGNDMSCGRALRSIAQLLSGSHATSGIIFLFPLLSGYLKG